MSRGSDPPRGPKGGSPGLKHDAEHWPGLHAQMTPTDGDDGLPMADLNPRFVEALMGLPDRWADPQATVTSFTSWVTALSLPASHTPGGNSTTD